MKREIIFFAVAVVAVLSILSFGITKALFSDAATSTNNTFVASNAFPTATPTITPTPGIAQTFVINEFLWDSSCGNASQEPGNYWIELYNGSSAIVNLKDWQFRDGNNNIIQISNSNTFIDPGEYVVVSRSSSVFSGCYTLQGTPETANLGGNSDFMPTTTGGVVKLEQPNGSGGFTVVDRVQYGPSQNGGLLNAPEDQSIARSPNGFDSALGDTFNTLDFIIDSTISPGVAN